MLSQLTSFLTCWLSHTSRLDSTNCFASHRRHAFYTTHRKNKLPHALYLKAASCYTVAMCSALSKPVYTSASTCVDNWKQVVWIIGTFSNWWQCMHMSINLSLISVYYCALDPHLRPMQLKLDTLFHHLTISHQKKNSSDGKATIQNRCSNKQLYGFSKAPVNEQQHENEPSWSLMCSPISILCSSSSVPSMTQFQNTILHRHVWLRLGPQVNCRRIWSLLKSALFLCSVAFILAKMFEPQKEE